MMIDLQKYSEDLINKNELKELKKNIENLIEQGRPDLLGEFYRMHNEAFDKMRKEYEERGLISPTQ